MLPRFWLLHRRICLCFPSGKKVTQVKRNERQKNIIQILSSNSHHQFNFFIFCFFPISSHSHSCSFSLYDVFNRGTSGIDIDLRRVDIDQCPQMKNSGAQQPLNIFAGTDKCKQRTTEVNFELLLFFAKIKFSSTSFHINYKCIPISGLGFRRGSYKCVSTYI